MGSWDHHTLEAGASIACSSASSTFEKLTSKQSCSSSFGWSSKVFWFSNASCSVTYLLLSCYPAMLSCHLWARHQPKGFFPFASGSHFRVFSHFVLLVDFIMASSTFSFDAFNELLGSIEVLTVAPASSMAPLPPSSTLSDESSTVVLGTDGSLPTPTGIVAAKKCLLWLPSSSVTFCLGCVGSMKFCTKAVPAIYPVAALLPI
jgi:hypothetical protein